MDRTAVPGGQDAPFTTVVRALVAGGVFARRFAVVLAIAAIGAPLAMSQDRASYDEGDLIRRVTFEGVEQLSEGELRDRIVTQPTRCRGLLLQPFCWLTDWHLITHRERLDEEEVRRDELRLEVHYFRRGYREARAASEIRAVDDGVEVVFTVAEGPPTLIARRSITQVDTVLSDRRIRRAQFPEEDELLDLEQLEEAIEHLDERLGELGYLDGVVRDSIAVDNGTHRAELWITIDSGPRSTVEEIEIEGNEDVADAVIREGLRIRPGEVLRRHHVAASQRSLYESNLFYEARIEVPEQPDSAKTVVVSVREAPPRRFEVGGGFNTLDFFQTEVVFTHFNWLGAGQRIELRATVGNLLAGQLNGQAFFHDVAPPEVAGLDRDAFLRPTWRASAEYRQPGFVAATDRVAISGFAHRRTIPGIVVEHSYGGTGSYTRSFTFRTPLSLSYRYEQTSVEAGDLYFCVNHGVCAPSTIDAVRGFNAMSPLVLSFYSDQSNDPLAPSRGYRVQADFEHASQLTLSDFRYNRASGSATYYLPFDARERRVLAGRVRGGWVGPLASTGDAIGIDAFDERLLHPRKRFFSGGSRSVRGYWENQLGPRVLTIPPTALEDAGCDLDEIVAGTCDPTGANPTAFTPRPTGGTTVLEGSVEYRFPITGALSGAMFVDGGVVGEGLQGVFTAGTWAITPGFGVRYQTPIGPIRIDLGFRPATVERLPVVTEFIDEEGDRRLITLDRRFSYDPIEAAGGDGFLNQILARLRLHLSIGEAL